MFKTCKVSPIEDYTHSVEHPTLFKDKEYEVSIETELTIKDGKLEDWVCVTIWDEDEAEEWEEKSVTFEGLASSILTRVNFLFTFKD